MGESRVSDAVLRAYLTQARRDLAQGDADSIAIPVRAMAALLEECARARAEAVPQMGYRTIKQLAERIADEQRVSEVAEWLADRILEANDDGEELHGLARLLLAGGEKYRLVDAVPAEVVWCHCLGTPEPTGNWVYPNDVHADTCGADVPARDPVRERREHEAPVCHLRNEDTHWSRTETQ